jgi:hypothetical protein
VLTWLLAAAAAWQTFAVGPFKTTLSGHTRAFWAAGVSEPTWVKDTFAGLAIHGYDGKTLTGEVDLWAGVGLDPKTCAVEIIYDTPGKRGIRVGRPTKLEAGAGGGLHAFWAFTADVDPSPEIFAATAFVFCPIDRAHEKPPWGAVFTSIEMIAAGPKAKDALCKKLGTSSSISGSGDVAGKKTLELAFACGVMPRVRGRELVDECRGDVLISLDTLGPQARAWAPAAGTPPVDEELRRFLGGSGECARITLDSFDPTTSRAWKAAVKQMGKRLLFAFSRDGMIQP